MKFACVLLVAMAACLAMIAVTDASPIHMVETSSKALAARQQVVSVPAAAAAASDDDDDDDDDEDIEDALDDDDDDDDEDDEPATGNQAAASDDDDDEDDDYIERFFDDILGDEEDDDDDEVSPSTGVQTPVAAPAAPAASVVSAVAPSADDAIAADYPIGDASDSAVYDDDAAAGAAEDGIQIIDTAPGDAVKEPSVGSAADTPVPVLNTNSVATAAAAASSSSSASDDDDDEEEEDDITDALDDDDDEEEEEVEADAEDDDDDDEDDLIGEDVIEARARSLVTSSTPIETASVSASAVAASADTSGPKADSSSSSTTSTSSSSSAVPDILINKYNRFVDGIFGRINTILKRSYDPVNVRLTTTTTPAGSVDTKATSVGSSSTKAPKKPHNKKRKSTKTKSHNKSRTATAVSASADPTPNANSTSVATPSHVTRKRSNDESNDIIAVGIPERFVTISNNVGVVAVPEESPENRAAQSPKPKKKTTATAAKTKPLKATPAKQTASAASSASPTTKAPVAAKPAADPASTIPVAPTKIQRARGVLYGLSTLQRQGNVRVNVLADHTTVRSNFRLGPLQLKVEKAFGRGAKRELKSATATTTEMMGRITLRIVNGAATLHSIKVQQPKQVQVVSADNHDRTREFLWKKSAHIADVVSQQLTAAARSMLQPPPGAVPSDDAFDSGATGSLLGNAGSVAGNSANNETAKDEASAVVQAAAIPAPVEVMTKTTVVELVGADELAHELRLEQMDQ